MSNAWSWFVIIGTAVTLAACFWLVAWTNRQRASDEEIAEAESHVWDEDVRELNNPLPMWWLWLFVLTVVWSAGYLIYYPGMGNYEGMADWSQEQQYADEVAAAEAQYGPMFAEFGGMEVSELVSNERALGIGFSLYQNYCSQCHGSTAQGARGFPDLTDDEWLFGGEPAQIEQSIVAGRTGVMPPLNAVFGSEEAVDEMIRYVQNMPDGMDTTSPAHTQYMQLCVACHGPTGTGMQALGAPSLVDDTWLYGSSPGEIRKTIVEGRAGAMPAHGDLIGPDRARTLTAYVYSLSQ
jgi:cytochrome c oxidase cbb3-type subunit 3